MIVYPLVLTAMLTVVLEGVITSRRVRKIAAERYPGEPTKGVGFYAIIRSAQIRRLRLPPPRVKRGDKICELNSPARIKRTDRCQGEHRAVSL